MTAAFPLGAKVRFTPERLSVLTPRDRKGLAGRIGVVQTDGKRIKKPTVYFPAEGARPELRLFRVDPGQLEIVELPPPTETPPPASADASHPAADAGDQLSQGDLDKMFE